MSFLWWYKLLKWLREHAGFALGVLAALAVIAGLLGVFLFGMRVQRENDAPIMKAQEQRIEATDALWKATGRSWQREMGKVVAENEKQHETILSLTISLKQAEKRRDAERDAREKSEAERDAILEEWDSRPVAEKCEQAFREIAEAFTELVRMGGTP